jgi:predicted DsbA family dithiol-disulfide isomerase
MNQAATVRISSFTDVLCVWAYVSQVRIDELQKKFGDRVAMQYHFFPLFGSTEHRIGERWKDRGGFTGYAEHVAAVCAEFPHIDLSPDAWTRTVPRSSAPAHHFLKAVQWLETDGKASECPEDRFDGRSRFEATAWRTRLAFFRDGRDVSRRDCLLEIAAELDLPVDRLEACMNSGAAMAAMSRDDELRHELKVEGSPTLILNDRRQKLYGNIGYKILEANVHEVLNRPRNRASWC